MTNVVKKGSGRAAHAEKVKRHAQRNPTVGAGKATTARVIKEEVKKASSKKAAAKKVAAVKKGAPTTTITDPKVQRLVDAAGAAGWRAVVDAPNKVTVKVTTVKDDESIETTFTDGKLDLSAMPMWTVKGGRSVKLKNVSAVIKQMSGSGLSRETASRAPKSKAESKEARIKRAADRGHVPFKADADDDQVLAALMGRKIYWTNSVSGTINEASVPPDPHCPKCGRGAQHEGDKQCHRSGCGGLNLIPLRNIKFETTLAGRVFSFPSGEGPFRSVLLERIVDVR